MVRRMGAKGLAAGLVAGAGAGLVWCVLACTESPMAYSPDGKSLAFVTMEPYETFDLRLAGPRGYRLFVLSGQKELRLVEQTAEAMLTGPGWSPDGKRICYLRIPLLTPGQLADLEATCREAKGRQEQAASRPAPRHPLACDKAELRESDVTMPSASHAVQKGREAEVSPATPAQLVIRRTGDWAIEKTVDLELPGIQWYREKGDKGLMRCGLLTPYLEIRPQFGPDGKWIYFSAGEVLWGINPEDRQKQILAMPASWARLSPDGKTLAFLHNDTVGFIRTDASKATYVRVNEGVDTGALAWADNDTVAILSKDNSEVFVTKRDESKPLNLYTLTFLAADGTRIPLHKVPFPDPGGDFEGLATSGRAHTVVSFGSKVFFLDPAGKTLRCLESAADSEESFVNPVFSPDSKTVALKLVKGKSSVRAGAIVFFTPDGKELSRVAIPPIPASATRPAFPLDLVPASQPATSPADLFPVGRLRPGDRAGRDTVDAAAGRGDTKILQAPAVRGQGDRS